MKGSPLDRISWVSQEGSRSYSKVTSRCSWREFVTVVLLAVVDLFCDSAVASAFLGSWL